MTTTPNVQASGTAPPIPTACEADPSQKKLAAAVSFVFAKKDDMKVAALNSKFDRFNPFVIGGDAFTMATFAFQGMQIVAPQVSHLTAIATANTVCGLVAGVINIGVGVTCFKESMKALQNGHKIRGIRLLIDSVTLTAIGCLMILLALSTQVTALSPIGAFFQARPWVLPVLFFIISLPVIYEISRSICRTHNKDDLASKLDLDRLQKLLEKNDVDAACNHLLEKLELQKVNQLPEKEQLQELSNKMEALVGDIGVEAALAVFALLSQLQKRDRDASLEALKKVQAEIRDWNNVQHVRLFQQFLYVGAFVVSLILLSPKIAPSAATAISATQRFAMTGANAIPLVIDSTLPFKRNPAIEVPKVEVTRTLLEAFNVGLDLL